MNSSALAEGGGNRELRIELPDSTWRPRAELWAKALMMLDGVLEQFFPSNEDSGSDPDFSDVSD